MKILKHGNQVKEHIYTCQECGCQFVPLDTELGVNDDGTQYARCPECGHHLDDPHPNEPSPIEKRHMRREEIVHTIMNMVDVERIHTAMVALEWNWCNGHRHIPTQEEIKEEIIRKLRSAWDNERDEDGGGIGVKYMKKDKYGDEGLRFCFKLEDYGAFHSLDGNLNTLP